ncbi:unnamed protein product [Brachionus calyciflorus]|uniref:RING-type domain-containing protein n=1 Tax=Brachionus calyciflorus TaxID=104777 RepID=A0A814BQ01_9BILA|nr:unnamed protein product [Brachionus calyciflorus]
MERFDIMISGIPNEVDAFRHLSELLRPLEQEFTEIEWFKLHQIAIDHPNPPRTTYAFVRFSDPNTHPQIVARLNGKEHRGRNLNVRINPKPTPRHILEPEYSPRVQRQIDRLKLTCENLTQTQSQLQIELEGARHEVDSLKDQQESLNQKILQLEAHPLQVTIKNPENQITKCETDLTDYRVRFASFNGNTRSMMYCPLRNLIHSTEKEITRLKSLVEDNKVELNREFDQVVNLRQQVSDQLILIDDLRAEVNRLDEQLELLRRQNDELVVENRQLTSKVEQLQQILEQQLHSGVDSTVYICPIYVEQPLEGVGIIALMCGHTFCRNCFNGIRTRMDWRVPRACPECRFNNVNEFIELHLS